MQITCFSWFPYYLTPDCVVHVCRYGGSSKPMSVSATPSSVHQHLNLCALTVCVRVCLDGSESLVRQRPPVSLTNEALWRRGECLNCRGSWLHQLLWSCARVWQQHSGRWCRSLPWENKQMSWGLLWVCRPPLLSCSQCRCARHCTPDRWKIHKLFSFIYLWLWKEINTNYTGKKKHPSKSILYTLLWSLALLLQHPLKRHVYALG